VSPAAYGPAVWYRADEAYTDAGMATQCINDGDLCYTLKDLSGNGRHAIQATSANRPAWYGESLPYLPSFRPVLLFDGVNDFLSHSGFSASYPCTLFAVGRRNSATASVIGALAGNFQSGTPASTTMTIRSGDGTTHTNGVGFARDAGPANISDAMTGFSDVTWWVWEFVASASTLELKRSGNTNGTTAATPAGMTSQPFSVGARSNAGADPFPGAIAEIVLLPGANAGRDNALRTAYFGPRYGITVV